MDAVVVIAAEFGKFLFAAFSRDPPVRKFSSSISVGLVLLSLSFRVALAAQPVSGIEPPNVGLKWLGTAGWEVAMARA